MEDIFERLYDMTAFSNIIAEPQFLIMYAIAFILLYLGIKKKYEPLLLIPIAFGVLLANFPGGEMGVVQADHSFDAITLWHVMEHLEHLNETWEKLFKLLKERGVLIVAVPNPSSYDAEKYKEWWAAYDVPRHLWHFTPSVMQQFGVKHGFKLAEQHPMPFDAFYVSMLTERYKGSRLSFLKGMWTGLLAWFSSLAKKERSSSMIYVFRKK